ncbi:MULTISPECIES: hypothetical protein [Sphingobacterium]|uniref:hypothetical protein n=1 Tax=Sphingobacterium TaxID=28453 RepID=UPI0008A3EEB9|nr:MULTISPECIES: hypothetical protein [Sphingobacterium]OFV19519.1 hypothetical protein HMPREF3127_04685 [Sphingobacterium sp. HMSC13C05]
MTPEQVDIYRKASQTGAISNEMNPLYLFSITHTHLLIRIVSGELDARVLAGMELNRRSHELGKDFPAEGIEKKAAQKKTVGKSKGRKL